MPHPVWFPHGSRLAAHAAADQEVRALRGFIQRAADALARGSSFPDAGDRAMESFPDAAAAFERGVGGRFGEAGFAPVERLMFPPERLPRAISFAREGAQLSFRLDGLLARDLRALLALVGSGRFTAEQVAGAVDEPLSSLFDALLERGVVAHAPLPALPDLPDLRRPGVTRLQHASVLYRGRESGVLVDPHLGSAYEPAALGANVLRCQLEGRVDAILITHGHEDHWHLPTLMTFPPDTLVVVPKVSRASMLCPDFAATLRALGFTRVVPLGWYDPPVRVGDLEVHALPFYGEQPLRHGAPRHPDLRNHGNTYVVRHESYTSWLLVDSGDDHRGCMADVAREVRARLGPVDWLLGNLREFAISSPLYVTGGHYWLALDAEHQRRFSTLGDELLTLGPRGVAEICDLAQARTFLPYAHWWGELAAPPGEEERGLVLALERELARRGARTVIAPWRIGGSLRP